MVWLSSGEKNLKTRLLVLKVTDGRTDRRTPHDGIDRAYIASRCKNPMTLTVGVKSSEISPGLSNSLCHT